MSNKPFQNSRITITVTLKTVKSVPEENSYQGQGKTNDFYCHTLHNLKLLGT
jgi:hypothetical protein